MPAPSPLSSSLPVAPRWARCSRAETAWSTRCGRAGPAGRPPGPPRRRRARSGGRRARTRGAGRGARPGARAHGDTGSRATSRRRRLWVQRSSSGRSSERSGSTRPGRRWPLRGPKIVHGRRSGLRPPVRRRRATRLPQRRPRRARRAVAAGHSMGVMTPRHRRDVVVVGGGVIGLAVGLAGGRRPARSSPSSIPSPGRGATWAAAGMLAPVAEAHFGEEALAAAQRGRRPGLARLRPRPRGRRRAGPSTTATDGTLLVAADPSDRAATDRRARLPPGPRAARPAARRPGVPGRRAAPGPGDQRRGRPARRPPGRQPARWSAALVDGLPGRRRRPSSPTGGRVDRRAAGWPGSPSERADAGRRRRGGGRRQPVGRVGGLPDGAPAPGAPGQGRHRPPAGPGRRPPAAPDRAGAGARPHLLPGAPRRTGPGGRAPPSRRRGFDLDRAARSAWPTSSTTPGGWSPPSTSTTIGETTTGLRPGSPDNGPIVGATAVRRAGGGHRPLPQRHPAGPAHRRRGGPPARRRRTPAADRRPPGPSPPSGRTASPPTGRWRPVTAVTPPAARSTARPGRRRRRDHGGRPGGVVVPVAQGGRGGPQRRGGAEERLGRHRVGRATRIEIVTAAAGGLTAVGPAPQGYRGGR